MYTILISDNEDKIRDLITQMIKAEGNVNFEITKQENVINIVKRSGIYSRSSTLEEKIAELENALFKDKTGALYKSVLNIVEKPLIEKVLERTDGNQLKAARILGLNRNTIRAKIKKLGIDVSRWKTNT